MKVVENEDIRFAFHYTSFDDIENLMNFLNEKVMGDEEIDIKVEKDGLYIDSIKVNNNSYIVTFFDSFSIYTEEEFKTKYTII